MRVRAPVVPLTGLALATFGLLTRVNGPAKANVILHAFDFCYAQIAAKARVIAAAVASSWLSPRVGPQPPVDWGGLQS